MSTVLERECIGPNNMIFVFGSNLAGRHGAGAARYAMEHKGAVYGIGIGMIGQSYAIPTKGFKIETLPKEVIQYHTEFFLGFAEATLTSLQFEITRIGCGLAGYEDKDIAPLFVGAPINCHFYEEWRRWLPNAQCDLGPSPK